MDIIYTNPDRREIGVLKDYSLDMACGDENDFVLKLPKTDGGIWYKSIIYAPGTEFGGMITGVKAGTVVEDAEWRGKTWHGLLQSRILSPDAGQDWLEVSGDANDVLLFLADRIGMSDLFTAKHSPSGIGVSNYRFERYIDAYTGITSMLAKNDARLVIEWDEKAVLSAAPVVNMSDDEADSEHVDLSVSLDFRPVNHLICLGKGDLRDRVVIHLYADADGNVSQTQTLFGLDEEQLVYDYSNAEADELLEKGVERLKNLQNPVKCSINLDDSTEYGLGDIVGGRESITGISAVAPVGKKILRIDDEHIDGEVEYEVGEIVHSKQQVNESGAPISYTLPTATGTVKGGVRLTDQASTQSASDGLAATPKAVRTGSTAQMTVEEDVSGTGTDRVRVLNADGEVLGGAPLPYERIPSAAIASLFE